ncbi:fatty acyl-CoA reductase wat-like isoform X2 [Leptopilina boulardi]|nr:fatty acyl-CoA reductase wat-like isoform X2 [Leptopilina boulardi]XP_051171894.1 fatty acyl-CoA reductase wat-like isoform X2 [Leptopilina boulardi]
MVEILLESGGQEVATAESGSRAGTPTECTKKLQNNISNENLNLTPIQEFYVGQSIFITGGTGFMGKLLIEKLLRSCPGIAFIYLLVRPKKEKDVHQRIEELFDDALFSRLKEEQPKFRHQIVAVSGDCGLPGLGLSSSDRTTLIREVSIVFHVAATVRFDEKIKLAVAINVQAPKEIISLSKEMSNLKSVIHVSTAYANCPHNSIEEKFYDPPMEANKLITLTDCADEKLIDSLTPQLLGGWPNTYTYTKAVAEEIVKKEAGNLPVGIFRPAIVVSTYKEPIPGWIDNMYGPTGVAAGAGAGLLRSIHCDGSLKANIVPGDLTVNALIASAWDVSSKKSLDKESTNEIPIYNFVSKDNPVTWDELKEMSEKYGIEVPSIRSVWYYSFRNNKYRLIHLFYVYFFHLLPALLVDAICICMGKQLRLMKIYKKIHRFMDVLNYFTTKEWKFSNDRVHNLINRMSAKDRENFSCDMREIVWDTFFKTYIKGIRIYLIKDPMETLPQARVRWQRMYWLHQAVKVILGYIAIRLAWMVLSTIISFFI